MRLLNRLAVLFLFAVPAFGQGIAFHDTAVANNGGFLSPVGGATITVCAGGNALLPCTPAVTIYSDITLLAPKVNPFSADGNGNYAFFVAANSGGYTVSVSGVGIADYSYQITAPTGGGTGTVINDAPLTVGLPVIGNGTAHVTVGTRTGNTTQYATWIGTKPGFRCVDTDGGGNLQATAADCGAAGGSPNQVQFNCAGIFCGDSSHLWDSVNKNLTIVQKTPFPTTPAHNTYTGTPTLLVGSPDSSFLNLAPIVGIDHSVAVFLDSTTYNGANYAQSIEAIAQADGQKQVVTSYFAAIANQSGSDIHSGNSATGAGVFYTGSANITGTDAGIEGGVYTAWNAGTGNLSLMAGIESGAGNISGATGTITDVTGFYVPHGSDNAADTWTNHYGLLIRDIGFKAASGVQAAVRVDQQSLGGYAFYAPGTSPNLFGGLVTSAKYATTTNCGANGSAANPSLVTCTAAAAGAFSCDTAASTGTCVVSTTAVTANSEITVQQVSYLNARLSKTCNTSSALPAGPLVTSISAGTSFTITLGTVTTNPACFIFEIVN